MDPNKTLNMTMLCDFYELTMGNGYLDHNMQDRITYFDVFFRSVPDDGGYAIEADELPFVAQGDRMPTHVEVGRSVNGTRFRRAGGRMDLVQKLSGDVTGRRTMPYGGGYESERAECGARGGCGAGGRIRHAVRPEQPQAAGVGG